MNSSFVLPDVTGGTDRAAGIATRERMWRGEPGILAHRQGGQAAGTRDSRQSSRRVIAEDDAEKRRVDPPAGVALVGAIAMTHAMRSGCPARTSGATFWCHGRDCYAIAHCAFVPAPIQLDRITRSSFFLNRSRRDFIFAFNLSAQL
jgi:hypothetical protein